MKCKTVTGYDGVMDGWAPRALNSYAFIGDGSKIVLRIARKEVCSGTFDEYVMIDWDRRARHEYHPVASSATFISVLKGRGVYVSGRLI